MTPLIIGLDASRAAKAQRTGTETYSLELLKQFAQLATAEQRVRLYTAHPPRHTAWPTSPYVETRVMPFPRLWTHVRLASELQGQPPDILFVPAHVLPFHCPVPAVVTVHDLGYLHYPEAHRPFERWYLDWTTRRHCRVARHIIADSVATKNDLVNFYGADPARITVVYLGRNEQLQRVDDLTTIATTKQRYNIEGDYLLYLGTLQPRKNLVRLVEAFYQAVTALQNSHLKLVIAGQRGWLYAEIFERVQALGVTERVIFPGYVADEDKAALLSGALAYTMPSLYEGFGLPILEAMACGTPVLTSHVSALPEVAGKAAILVNPHNTAEIATGLIALLTQPHLRQQLVTQGYCQVAQFSWAKAATQIWQILEFQSKISKIQNPKSKIPTATILNVKIHAVTNAQTLDLIEQFIASRQPHQLVTVNPEFVMAAQTDEPFRQIVNQAALALPDGIGLLKAAKFLRTTPLPERVPGSDLVIRLAELSHQHGYRIYFLGAWEGVAEQAIAKLKTHYPKMQVAGYYAGSPSMEENEAIVQRILPTRADILLVAYGAPKQDKWIARNLERLQIPVCIGVGGSFDFIAGTAKRAPLCIQNLGLEWLHRLIMEPWRWRRIWNAVPRFGWRVLWSRWS